MRESILYLSGPKTPLFRAGIRGRPLKYYPAHENTAARPPTAAMLWIVRGLSSAVLVIFAASLAMADAFQYESHGKRDPFVPLIGQDKNAIVKLADITSADDLKLEGIAIGPEGKMTAIINGEIVREGSKVGEIGIEKITVKSVDLSISGKDFSLKLPEEGGQKSE